MRNGIQWVTLFYYSSTIYMRGTLGETNMYTNIHKLCGTTHPYKNTRNTFNTVSRWERPKLSSRHYGVCLGCKLLYKTLSLLSILERKDLLNTSLVLGMPRNTTPLPVCLTQITFWSCKKKKIIITFERVCKMLWWNKHLNLCVQWHPGLSILWTFYPWMKFQS